MADILSARVWVSQGTDYTFAEQASGLVPADGGTGVCFSGGGTRALSAAMGQLRALTALQLVDKISYISCVSGGSWASTAYTYYRTGADSDEVFLGPVTAPQDITMDGLGQLAEGCLGHTATRSLRDAILKLLYDGAPKDEVWIRAVGEIFFQPFGLYAPDQPAYFSLDQATVSDIVARNPGLGDAACHTVRQGAPRPFLVVNGTLVGPARLAPFEDESLAVLQYTPLYVGSPFGMEVDYQPAKKVDGPTQYRIGGGFVEPFAFGGPGPAADPAAGLVQLDRPQHPLQLADASGVSSAAYAGFSSHDQEIGVLDGLKGLAPETPYWPVGAAAAATNFDLGDGGILENYGLISLLQRGVKRIAVFVNTNTPLDADAAPEKLERGKGIDSNLLALFGYSHKSTGVNLSRNQVFAQADFAGVAAALQAAKKAGRAVMATSELAVQGNTWWGVEGGWTVQVLWCYLDRVAEWESQLAQPIRHAIDEGNSSWFARGPFKHFPNYATIDENFLDLVELTPEQVNLLADLCCWTVSHNADAFKELLG